MSVEWKISFSQIEAAFQARPVMPVEAKGPTRPRAHSRFNSVPDGSYVELWSLPCFLPHLAGALSALATVVVKTQTDNSFHTLRTQLTSTLPLMQSENIIVRLFYEAANLFL